MELEGQALLFFLVAIFFLILNYFNLRSIVYFKPSATFKANVAVYNYHQIIVSLERVFRVIVILTSLGFLSSLSTFFFISMEYFTFKSLNYLFTLLPLLFIVYLIFAIPSFYGLKELNQIKYFLKQFKEIKNDVKTQFMTN